jgi:uncharacterized integral membrane protein (TIGR00698 family)
MTSYKEDFLAYFSIGKSHIAGILFCCAAAAVAFLLTRGTLFDGGFQILPAELFETNPVFSFLSKVGPIVFALILCLFINVKYFKAGGSYAGKFILRLAIILMGARVTVDVLLTASVQGFVIILAVLAVTIFVAMKLGKRLKKPWDACALTGSGTGICGVSAALSVASVINAGQKYVHAVVGIISILGLAGVFIIPFLAFGFDMTVSQAEVFIGGTLHEIGNVIPAAELYTALGGEEVAALALAYKMIRVAMLVVVAAIFSHLWMKRNSGETASEKPKLQGFLILFVVLAVLMSLFIFIAPEAGRAVQGVLVNVSVTLLTVAMAGVGLSMNLKETFTVGKTLLPFASVVWAVQVVLMLILTKLFV